MITWENTTIILEALFMNKVKNSHLNLFTGK